MPVHFRAGDWVSPPTVVAAGFIERLRGLRPRSDGQALLLRGKSVHGIGMKESLWVVALDVSGVVLEVRLLRPRRIVRVAEASWLLEMAATLEPPPTGFPLLASGTLERRPRAGSG